MNYSFHAPLHTSPKPSLTEIEVQSQFQIPHFQLIGLASREVLEAKDRVRQAILSSGFEFPKRRVVVNLAPSEIQKSGTEIDLAIALAILHHQNKSHPALACVASGELSLLGAIQPTRKIARALGAAYQLARSIQSPVRLLLGGQPILVFIVSLRNIAKYLEIVSKCYLPLT